MAFPRRVTPVILVLSLLGPSPATAFQNQTTATGQNIYWPSFPIPYLLNAQGAPGAPGALAAVRAALQTWAQVPGTAIQFTDGGTTPLAVSRQDGTNVVFWQTGALDPDVFEAGTLAVTTTYYRLTGEILEADIEFNGHVSPGR